MSDKSNESESDILKMLEKKTELEKKLKEREELLRKLKMVKSYQSRV